MTDLWEQNIITCKDLKEHLLDPIFTPRKERNVMSFCKGFQEWTEHLGPCELLCRFSFPIYHISCGIWCIIVMTDVWCVCCLKLCPPPKLSQACFPRNSYLIFVFFELTKALIWAWTFQFSWRGWSSQNEQTTSMIRFPSICSAWIPDMNVRHPYSSYSPFDCIRFHMHLLTSTKIHSQFFKRKTLHGHLITIHFILFYIYQTNTPQKQKDPVIFFSEEASSCWNRPRVFVSGAVHAHLFWVSWFRQAFLKPKDFRMSFVARWWQLKYIFLFSPQIPGEMINFDSYLSNGLVQPPASFFVRMSCCWWFRNPVNSPVEVGSLSTISYDGFYTSQVVLDFWTINSINSE